MAVKSGNCPPVGRAKRYPALPRRGLGLQRLAARFEQVEPVRPRSQQHAHAQLRLPTVGGELPAFLVYPGDRIHEVVRQPCGLRSCSSNWLASWRACRRARICASLVGDDRDPRAPVDRVAGEVQLPKPLTAAVGEEELPGHVRDGEQRLVARARAGVDTQVAAMRGPLRVVAGAALVEDAVGQRMQARSSDPGVDAVADATLLGEPAVIEVGLAGPPPRRSGVQPPQLAGGEGLEGHEAAEPGLHERRIP